jgi:hypothetical protein
MVIITVTEDTLDPIFLDNPAYGALYTGNNIPLCVFIEEEPMAVARDTSIYIRPHPTDKVSLYFTKLFVGDEEYDPEKYQGSKGILLKNQFPVVVHYAAKIDETSQMAIVVRIFDDLNLYMALWDSISDRIMFRAEENKHPAIELALQILDHKRDPESLVLDPAIGLLVNILLELFGRMPQGSEFMSIEEAIKDFRRYNKSASDSQIAYTLIAEGFDEDEIQKSLRKKLSVNAVFGWLRALWLRLGRKPRTAQ